MISADFAPNETWHDAASALKMLVLPWRWRTGNASTKVKLRLKKIFPESEVFLHLTARGALYRLLQVLNLPQGTSVAVTGYTCEAVVLPVIASGHNPLYIDIEPESYSMSAQDLEKKFTFSVKVLILQHTYGLTPRDRDKIMHFAKKHKIFIIEDLAHGWVKMPLKKLADHAYLLSFGRSKVLSSVFGGAIVTQKKRLAESLKTNERTLQHPSPFFIFRCLLYKPLAMLVRTTYAVGFGKLLHKILDLTGVIPREISQKEKRGEFDAQFVRMFPNAFASLLLTQLKRFESIQAKRVQTATLFAHDIAEGPHEAVIRYPMLVGNRDQLVKVARKKGIYLGLWYDVPVAPRGVNPEKMFYRGGSCPEAERICGKIINLPTLITPKEVKKVTKFLLKHAG